MMPMDNSVNANRRVSNLSAEQADKKRAIDRENQRYHRAKNKAYIRSLEDKIDRLTARLDEVEGVLEQYRKRESHVQQGVAGVSQSPANLTLTLPTSITQSNQAQQITEPVLSGDSVTSYLDSLPLDLGTGMTIQPFNAEQDLNLLDWDLNGVLDNFLPTTEVFHLDAATETALWDTTGSQTQIPEWQRMPLHLPPTTKLDQVIITTTTAWRARLQNGLEDDELKKSVFPSISSLLNRPRNLEQILPGTFFETVAAQVWRSPIRSLPERISFMYILSHYIRWLVCRTKETYYQMPAFLRPTELQRTVPHAAWIDMSVRPAARDAHIREMDLGRFEELRLLVGRTINVSWPYPDSAAVVESPDKQTLMLHPVFEAHIRKVENWKYGKELFEAFPHLRLNGSEK
ncbi:hypothetical protein F66182_7809 [Fusarium sp. NRRL 66182]|nr:hypothetical protein F66182_7809 [Fusarium sp. NRRL 66182]